MSHAELCPVCMGIGKISTGIQSTGGEIKNVCHGCYGKGWVVVSDDTYSTNGEERKGERSLRDQQ